jgi:hypothetical protein
MKRKPKTAPIAIDNLVPLTEAAKLADVTEVWLRKLVAAGKVRGLKIGRNYVVDVESAKQFQRHPTAGRPRKPSEESDE